MPRTFNLPQRPGWQASMAALLAATGLGFAAAKLTTPKPASAPVGAEAAAEAPVIDFEIDPARLIASGVQVEAVSVGGLASEIVAQGAVESEPTGRAILTARAAGSVARMTKHLGDSVRAGETLALLESRDAAQIAADRSVAATKADLARRVLARERRLYEQKVSPRQDYEAAQAELAAAEAEARRASAAAGAAAVSRDGRYLTVTSPIAGRITAMSVSLGAFVQPETVLFEVADPSKIQIEAAVTATDVQRIQPGDAAIVEVGAGPAVAAVVRSITPGLNPETRSATVVLTLSGDAGTLRPGQLVRTRITARGSATAGVVVPRDAVQTLDGHDAVFVRTAKGFRVQRVTLGPRAGGRVAIVQGLAPGDRIAVQNAFLLKAELGKSSEDDE